MASATAIAHPNIALIKYWGVQDDALNLPASGSLSMTLDGLETRTMVTFDKALSEDTLELDGQTASHEATARASAHLDRIRHMARSVVPARVVSRNSFPTSAGIASSASGFAALTLAAATALGLDLPPKDLSILARKGSGSAARSIFGGFAEWHKGEDDQSSFAKQIWPPEHWKLVDWIAVVDRNPKSTGSHDGHRLASTSPFQEARVASAPQRLAECRSALMARDFQRLAAVVELDSHMMHAVMMTSFPPLLYWSAGSIQLMKKIAGWRADGLDVCYTLDAGPTVHCITTAEHSSQVEALLRSDTGVLELFRGIPGPPAHLVAS
jgi:diphosphomevalonate decarboxylase